MVYDKRPRREGQTPSSYEQQTGSSSRNIYRSDKPSPIIEQLRQRWIDKRQARKEQEWFDSLPVLDPDGRGISSTKDRNEKPDRAGGKGAQPKKTKNRPESATEQQEKRRESAAQGITQGRQAEPESPESDASFGKPRNLEDSKNRKSQDQTEGKGKGKELEPKKSEREKRKRKKEQEQKKKKEKEGKGKGKVQGKKRGGWFSFFGAGKSPDKKLKSNQTRSPKLRQLKPMTLPQAQGATTIAVPQDRVATAAKPNSPPRKITPNRQSQITPTAEVQSALPIRRSLQERRRTPVRTVRLGYQSYRTHQYSLPPTSMQSNRQIQRQCWAKPAVEA